MPAWEGPEMLPGPPGVDTQLTCRSAAEDRAGAADHQVFDSVKVEVPSGGHVVAKVRVHASLYLMDHLTVHAGVDPDEGVGPGVQEGEVRSAHRVIVATITVHITQATDSGPEVISVAALAEVLSNHRSVEP